MFPLLLRNFTFLLLIFLLFPYLATNASKKHNFIKGFYKCIHPIEVGIYGHDAMYECEHKGLPKDVSEKEYTFFPYQEKIWENQLGLKNIESNPDLSKEQQEKSGSVFFNEIVRLKSELKEILENGEIVALKEMGAGVHPSYVAVLTLNGNKDKAIRALVKPDRALDGGADSYAELAAYEFDQLLDFQLVPMVVQRSFYKGKKASLQYFVNGAIVAKKVKKKERFLTPKIKRFDYLTRQWDRRKNPGNYLYLDLKNPVTTSDVKKIVAIDHGTAFQKRGHPLLCHRIFSLDKGKVKKLLDRDYKQYQAIKDLTLKELQEKVPSLTEEKALRLLKRRDHFVYKVDKTMKRMDKADEGEFFKTFPTDEH